MSQPKTILCIASYEKGHEFLRQAKREGWKVVLLTSKSIEHKAKWPVESIDEIFYIPDKQQEWNMNDVIYGVSFMARTIDIDRIVALDDYDVEKAAAVREHLRVPGMGDTTARYFRDKLAMRRAAASAGIAVPEFVHILNYRKIGEFLEQVPPPYVLKPRLQAGAIGIKKIHAPEELWATIEELGDKQSFYVLERFVPGQVHHVDSIIFRGEIRMAIAHEYGAPPMEVAHEGRVFSTRTMIRGTDAEQGLLRVNRQILSALGLEYGVSHTEFIRSRQDGKFYFLETSARVGGAHIVDLVEAATGLNLWAEWAKIETSGLESGYDVKPARNDFAGLMICLARQEWPDLSAYDAPEIYWKLNKRHHVGLIVHSPSYERVTELMDEYTQRLYRDFFTFHPMGERPTD